MFQPNIRQQNGKDYIFCVWRRKFVRLTPEEWVRQNFLHALLELGYPQEKIAVEASITLAGLSKRCDAIIYDAALQPICIVEFKAPTVALSQKVFDQVAVYNKKLEVEHFILSNGKLHKACKVNDNGYEMLDGIPFYEELCLNKSSN